MERNILSEIDQIKYLFGYKAGKVISEQTTPSGNVQQSTNSNQLFNEILNAIKNKAQFIYSPNIPGKIIANPSISIQNSAYGFVTFTLIAPSDGVVEGQIQQMEIIPNGGFKLSTPEAITPEQVAKGEIVIKKPTAFASGARTIPMNTAQVMFFVGGEKNPLSFAEFLQKNFGEKAKQSLITSLSKIGNSMAKVYDPTPEEARTILQKLNVQPQQNTQVTE
jgi:hypothetical protein